ncbi:preprotein translocase subunit SecG [Roseomonas sp. KE2513]|uniref:preprotein translocase subunit SecG n=1 Tax=Roseomonas sp. KE2513 TaxID=2479202 RepID=UPI0018DF968D|nr:preprotein translocase subunit SecG [Roseomonas sp. KE2513]MBI0536586.1 preprotein translocase subunit SecG [Roseomonas sp. KE2513]
MITVLLVLHFFVAAALIGVVLLQRSEGGGLGIGSSQGMGSFMSGRGTANLLTRATGVLAAIFMALALALGLMNQGTGRQRSIFDAPPPSAAPGAAPGGAPAAGGTPAAPALPALPPAPSVPNN